MLSLPTLDITSTAAQAAKAKAQMQRTNLVRFGKGAAGNYEIRFLPQHTGDKANPISADLPFYRRFGVHLVPRADGQKGFTRFVCDQLTYGRPCKIDQAIIAWRTHVKALKAQNQAPDSVLDSIISNSNAGDRYLVNAIILRGQNADPNRIQVLDLSRTQFETVLLAIEHIPTLLCPVNGTSINVALKPRAQGQGLEMQMLPTPGAAGAVKMDAATFLDQLRNLDQVLEGEFSNASPADAFTGDWLHPLAGGHQAPALAAPSSPAPAQIGYQQPMASSVAPGAPQGIDLSKPAAAPQPVHVQPQTAYTPPVTQSVDDDAMARLMAELEADDEIPF